MKSLDADKKASKTSEAAPAEAEKPVAKIQTGADGLGWTLEELMEKTILAMRSCEAGVAAEQAKLCG